MLGRLLQSAQAYRLGRTSRDAAGQHLCKGLVTAGGLSFGSSDSFLKLLQSKEGVRWIGHGRGDPIQMEETS